jgi:hypothetical protein
MIKLCVQYFAGRLQRVLLLHGNPSHDNGTVCTERALLDGVPAKGEIQWCGGLG